MNWFDELTMMAKKISFAEPDELKSIEQKKRWVEDKISKTIFEVAGAFGLEWIDEMMEIGKKKYEENKRKEAEWIYDGV